MPCTICTPGTEAEALTAALRAHVAAAALLAPAPTLSEAGLELLMGYYVAVRQSGVKVSEGVCEGAQGKKAHMTVYAVPPSIASPAPLWLLS